MVVNNFKQIKQQIDDNTIRTLLSYTDNLMGAKVHFKHRTESVELHSHIEEQLTYVLKGKFKFFIEEEEYILKAGDSLVFASNVRHGCLVLEENSELLDVFNPMRQDFI